MPCKNSAMSNGRCRMHGGKSTGAPKKPGALYSKYYTVEEKELAEQLNLASVDAELKLCKIRLNRALKEEAEQAGALQLERKVSQTPTMGGLPIDDEEISDVETKTYVKRDYEGIINQLTGRIQSLTDLRMRITGSSDGDTEDSNEIIVKVVDARKDADTKSPTS